MAACTAAPQLLPEDSFVNTATFLLGSNTSLEDVEEFMLWQQQYALSQDFVLFCRGDSSEPSGRIPLEHETAFSLILMS